MDADGMAPDGLTGAYGESLDAAAVEHYEFSSFPGGEDPEDTDPYKNYFGEVAEEAQQALDFIEENGFVSSSFIGSQENMTGGSPFGITNQTIMTANSISKFGAIASTVWGAVDINFSTGTYVTTQGIRKSIYLPNG